MKIILDTCQKNILYNIKCRKRKHCAAFMDVFGGGGKKTLVTLTSRSCRNKNYSYTNMAERSLSLDGIFFFFVL